VIRVEWEAAARGELGVIWAAAGDAELPGLERQVLGLLTDLRADPLEVGESRDGSHRVAVRPPLTVWFEVFDDGRRVRIFHVRRPTPRG
jgi:hypothetical protein